MEHIACAIFVRDQQVLLGRRAANKRVYPGRWDLIGGHVEAGETPELALIREAEEEVGLTPTRFVRAGATLQPRLDLYGEATFHVFTVREWRGGEPQLLGEEHTQIGWFKIEDACLLEALAVAEYRRLFRNLILSS